MRYPILAIVFFLGGGLAFAQFNSPTGGEFSRSGTVGQWQLTFDVIRSKVNALMDHNNQLSSEYKVLDDSRMKIIQTIDDLNKKNDEMGQLLKLRHGRTDQEMRIIELQSQWKLKQTQLASLQAKALDLKDQVSDQQKTIELKKTRIQDLELNQNMPKDRVISSSGDAQLDELRNDLEEEKQEEVRLEDQLSSMTKAVEHPEMNLLRQKLDFLLKEKQELLSGLKKPQPAPAGGVDHKVYYSTMEQKAALETKIRQFENRINSLKGTQKLNSNWAGLKKKLVRMIVQQDGLNAKLREQINNLREDVVLLREQIGVLEKKLGGDYGQIKHTRK